MASVSPSINDLFQKECIYQFRKKDLKGIFLGVKKETKLTDKIAFDGGNMRVESRATTMDTTSHDKPLTGLGISSHGDNNILSDHYLTFYFGENILVIEDHEVAVEPVDSPDIPDNGQFVEAVPSNGETKNLDFDCENCFKLVNIGTKRCMIVTLDNSIPRLQTKLKSKIDANDENIFFLMTVFETNQPSSTGDVALYFPSKDSNYYLKPDKDGCTIVVESRQPEHTNDDQLSRKHLYFTKTFENPDSSSDNDA